MNPTPSQSSSENDGSNWTRRSFGVAIASMAIGFPGCKVGPDFSKPNPPQLNANFYQSSLENKGVEDLPVDSQLSRWWTYFDDPMLQMLISDASQQNLTIKEAYFRIAE
jgi:outer membrane protein TolC